jgi:hypothetical protein
MKQLPISLAAVVFLLLALFSGTVNATIMISFSDSDADGDDTWTLPKFDSSLGTLLGADLSFVGEHFTTLELQPSSEYPGGDLLIGVTADFDVDSVDTLIALGNSSTPLPAAGPNDIVDLGVIVTPVSGSGLLDPLSHFTGAGTFDSIGDYLAGLQFRPSFLGRLTVANSLDGTMTVTYTYEPASSGVIPEPASVAVWSLLITMGTIAVRRKRRQASPHCR